MKKIRLIIIAAVLMVASAVNFGILSNSIGVNVAYACEQETNLCAPQESAECRKFDNLWQCWAYLGEPTLNCEDE